MTKDQQLIFEAMQIVVGESIMLPSKDHLRALLEERTNLIENLARHSDALVDAAVLPQQDVSLLALEARDDLHVAEWLEREDAKWAEKVISSGVEEREKELRKVS